MLPATSLSFRKKVSNHRRLSFLFSRFLVFIVYVYICWICCVCVCVCCAWMNILRILYGKCVYTADTHTFLHGTFCCFCDYIYHANTFNDAKRNIILPFIFLSFCIPYWYTLNTWNIFDGSKKKDRKKRSNNIFFVHLISHFWANHRNIHELQKQQEQEAEAAKRRRKNKRTRFYRHRKQINNLKLYVVGYHCIN